MEPAFDSIARLYDLLTDWGSRLNREIPFLHRALETAGARTVLDAACGTGVHLKALAGLGFEVAGTDVSPEMVARARGRLASLPDAEVAVADFARVGESMEERDAVIVIGNSLPNAGSANRVRESLAGLCRALRDGGLLVLHMLNYPKLLREGGGLRPLRRVEREGREYLFIKLFEVHREFVALNVIAITGKEQTLMRSELFPLDLVWLEREFPDLGLELVEAFGDFSGAPYDEETSNDLLVVARKRGGGHGG